MNVPLVLQVTIWALTKLAKNVERIATHALVPENAQDANLCTTKSEGLQIANTARVIVLHAELIMRNAQVAI